MLSKLVVLFLLAMVGIAMVGNVLYPGALKRRLLSRRDGSCPRCGRPQIGRRCDCNKKS